MTAVFEPLPVNHPAVQKWTQKAKNSTSIEAPREVVAGTGRKYGVPVYIEVDELVGLGLSTDTPVKDVMRRLEDVHR